MRLRPALSLRSKFILIVLGGTVLPLALLGVWLNQTAERSGEHLLRARLQSSLLETVDGIGLRWMSRRSQLLRLAESRWVQAALSSGDGSLPPPSDPANAPGELRELFAGMEADVSSVAVMDSNGGLVWNLGSESGVPAAPSLSDPALAVRVTIHEFGTGRPLGTLEARVRMASLLPAGAGWGGVSGSVLAVLDPTTGASLLPLSIDPALFAREEFVWGEEPWVTVHHVLLEPAMNLAMAAPVTPFAEPFQDAARRNLWILVVVALAGFFLAALMTRRITRQLVRLAEAAEAVSEGDLDRRVEEASGDEVGRVGRAFNSMAESLQETLQKLSQRQALAAVGEFAAGLAHEVRNPLTSVRLDMQRIQEELPEGSKAQGLLMRALGEIDRVNRSVTGALRVARSGSVQLETIDIRQPIEAAVHAAGPELQARGAELSLDPDSEGVVWVKGDRVALEQLLLNLLLNAAQAVELGGRVSVAVEREGDSVAVSVKDSGRGIPEEDLGRIAEPFFSTRPEGTGLGLAIAQRIAQAHGRSLEFESTPGVGTTVRLYLSASPPTQNPVLERERGVTA
ncbi:MAG: ATP-binding protein [Gemmatimonadota bacterium]